MALGRLCVDRVLLFLHAQVAVSKGRTDAQVRTIDAGCDSAIYRYFASLTEQFLAPLNRYFGTLWVGNEIVARK